MKLLPKEKSELIKLSEKASDLMVKIIDEPISIIPYVTRLEKEFVETIAQMHKISPLLSDSYAVMYNHIQEQKRPTKEWLFKRIDPYNPGISN